MITYITWLVTVASLVGVILNIHKIRVCFIIWAATNVWWCIYDFSIGAHAQSFLMLVYFVLAIWGIIKWRKK